MNRGTEVGRGYVALEINGEGMNEEIVNEVDSAGPGVEQAGEEHGERYERGFFARIRAKFQKGLADELNRNAERDGRASGGRLGGALIDGLQEQLSGSALAPLREQLLSDLEGITDRMVELRGRLDRSRSQNSRDGLTESLREARAEATRLSGQLRTLAAAELRVLRGRAGGVSGNRDNDTLGSRVSGLLGGNSRVGPLRVLGKTVGGVTDLVGKLGKAIKPVFEAFEVGFTSTEEGASLLTKTLSGLGMAGEEVGASAGKGIGSLIASGPAGAAAIAVIVVAMSVLVSVSSALLGILTAIVATIASALVGAAAVGAGALLAVVAAGGLLVAMFMSLTEAQKDVLKADFGPLKDQLVGIGQTVLNNLQVIDKQGKVVASGIGVFSVWADNLKKAIDLVGPLAAISGRAFGQAGDIITKSFSGPGFQALYNALGVYLPGIITHLSTALGGFLNGAAGLFAAIMPYVLQFAAYLEQVATRFSNFANSPEGQNKITDFVGRALISLHSLWDFLHQLSGVISDILFSPEAQSAGNGIFDGLTRGLAGFREKIADGSLQKWFADAIQFGGTLKDVFVGLGHIIGALYDSGVLVAVGTGFEALAATFEAVAYVLGPVIDLLGYALPAAMLAAVGPLEVGAAAILAIGAAVQGVGNILSHVPGLGFLHSDAGATLDKAQKILDNVKNQAINVVKRPNGVDTTKVKPGDKPGSLGNGGLDLGAIGAAAPQKYVNPYVAWANQLVKDGPTISAQIRNSIVTINKQIVKGIRDAAKSSDVDTVRSSLLTLSDNIKASAETTVNSAQQALNTAAQALAGATTKDAVNKALANVKKAQKDLTAALKSQDKIQKAAKVINAQRVLTNSNVVALLDGMKVQNATLADYAEARNRLADKIEKANQALADAISLRDQYKSSVVDSIKSFGSLVTAQAQSINGVEQALTSGDITANLQDRLQKIKDFQSNLNILLAQGLSQDAYKQILDAGVDGGAAYAQALVSGGSGAIQQVNGLVAQISTIADTLGTQASNRLYQAGVDAAQGLVDGLESLSAQLDSAAARLGDSIAKALKKSLGIKSPSRVMYEAMGYVGDGIEDGLDDQHGKAIRASGRLSDQIRVSPAAAAYANEQAASRVSGNSEDPRFRDLIVQTPTEDPKAVAQEVVNEIIGRL